MLLAYFDDSGKFADSDFICMAGYLSDDKNWEQFCLAWRDLLFKNNLPFIHMKDFVHLRGPYEELGWTHERKQKVLDEFITIIRTYILAGFGVAVDAKYYRSMALEARKLLGDPHLFCFQRLMSRFTRKLKESGWNEPIPVIFDDCEEYSVRCYRLWSAMRANYPDMKSQISAITFADDKIFYPLQGADILAWETTKHLRQMAEQRKLRPTMDSLMRTSNNPALGIEYISELWDGPELEKAYLEHAKVQ